MRTGTHTKTLESKNDREELVRLGKVLDNAPCYLNGKVTGHFLAEQLLRIRNRDGEMVPFKPNQAQKAFEERRGRTNIVLKSRQMGISTWIAGRFFLRTITQPGTLTLQVAHTQEAAEGIFRIVHRFVDGLPESLRDGVLRTSRANSRQIVFPELDSEYRVETAGDANAGRGLTIHNLHCSEVARWPGNASEILQGLRAAMPPHGELVLESTPNGAEGCFWEEWNNADQSGMVQHFFPWWWEDAYRSERIPEESLESDEQRLVEQFGLSLEQIGFRREIRTSFRRLARQEYPEDPIECFLSSGDCYFDLSALDQRVKDLPEPMMMRLGGKLQIWFPPVPERGYLVAIDTAGGGSEGDYSVAEVLDVDTGLQCAELKAKLSPLELAEEATHLAKEYNGALLVVERNNHGSGVLAYLHGVNKYPRIYRQNGQDGWLTSVIHRPRMLGTLAAALVETPEFFFSKRLFQECRSFVRHRNGKIGASAGMHDDCVMAMAMALCVREEIRR